MIVDLYLVYSFLKRLTTPFTEWEAFKLGIIDTEGNVLKKRNTFRTFAEKDAFGIFDVVILNIKKLLAKLPGGSTRLASYAAALYHMKEWKHFSNESTLTEDVSDEQIEESMQLFIEKYLTDDTVVGAGAIAGMGVGPQGEPGVSIPAAKRYKKKNILDVEAFIKKKLKEDIKVLPAPKTMNDIIAGEPKGKEKARIRKNKKHPRPTIELT